MYIVMQDVINLLDAALAYTCGVLLFTATCLAITLSFDLVRSKVGGK